MDPCQLLERKAALRRKLTALRAEVAAGAGEAAAAAVAARFEALRLPGRPVLSGYWPLAGELDPRPLLRRAQARGCALALPRMEGKGLPLRFHLWAPDEPLVPGPFKVMEPDPARPLAQPDVVLAPLLGFDRRGGRLGYGAGFYDRTIAALRAASPQLLVIGLAFAVQELDEVPMDDTDQPLDGVLTEAGCHVCSPRFEAVAQSARA